MTRLAVVTGGARRIGAAISRHLHHCGYDIALHYRSSAAAADALATELCQARPGSCQTFAADLEDDGQIQTLAAAILERFPSIDLLINNASGFLATPIDSCTPPEFDSMLGSNLRGPYFLTQALLPSLREARGNIVNIIDVHVDKPLPDFNAYGAAKAGLASLTRSLAVELGPDIRVNGVSPGVILWPEDGAGYDAAARAAAVRVTPLQRIGDPTDIARTVGFLALEAPFITGQIITVDGGRGLVRE